MTEVLVTLRDVDDARQILGACLNYFAALDLAERQRHLSTSGQSAIYVELERLKTRYDGYMGDYLMKKHEEELEEELEEEDESLLDVAEELTGVPFGSFEIPKQEGRIVTAEELRGRGGLNSGQEITGIAPEKEVENEV